MRLPGLTTRWWIAGAGVALAASATATALVLRSAEPACAGPRRAAPGLAAPGRAPVSGKATFYDADGTGACSFDRVATPMVVALATPDYRTGAFCGSYLDVSGPRGSIRVKVVDECPTCTSGHIDLSAEAFARIADPVDGVVPVSYRTVLDPPVPGPLTVRVKDGASAYWLALRFDNHGNVLTAAELSVGGAWQKLTHTGFNYWLDGNGAGGGPFTVRLTDSTGRRTTVPNIRLSPEQVQRTGVPMYAGAAAAAPARTPSVSASAAAAGLSASASAAGSVPAVPGPAPDGSTLAEPPPVPTLDACR